MLTHGMLITNRLRETGKNGADFAKELGVTRAYVYQIIHGHNLSVGPSAMNLREAIAEHLKTSAEELWPFLKGPKNPPQRRKLHSRG